MPAVATHDPDLLDCAVLVTREFQKRCPVAQYRNGTPGNSMVIEAVYDLLAQQIIEIGPNLR